MKKILVSLLATAVALSLAACGSSATEKAPAELENTPAQEATDDSEPDGERSSKVSITTLNAAREKVELEVPYNPQRIAVMDLGALDILDNLGLGNRVVGVSKGSSIDYLQSYINDDSILNLGTIKEADLEAVMACEPDVIFIGGRLSSLYDELSEIAPVIFLSTDTEAGVVKSTGDSAMAIASLFGLEDRISSLLADYDDRIGALSDFAQGKNAIVGMVNNGGFGVLGNDGRCSIIGREIGFENMSESDVTSTHGNESSFELLVAVDPDYIFIMDRDAAIGTDGAQLAQEVMENELVMMTSAYQNSNIVYLAHSNVWYTAEGGISALDTMLSDLETVLFA